MTNENVQEESGIVVTTDFVRYRNALVARASLTDLFIDYYLHLAGHGLTLSPAHDRLLKSMLAAFVLHCGSRPRNEQIAWTVNLQEPLLNLFAAGDNEDGAVTGRVFTENVKRASSNLFYSEISRNRGPVRRSVVDFVGSDLLGAVEAFYENSEQRPARLFDLGDENYALISAHPDCDETWLRQIDANGFRALAAAETLVPIERRRYRWLCGCDENRILRILAPAMQSDPDDLFQGEDAIRMECPRCAARYRIGREALEAYIARLES